MNKSEIIELLKQHPEWRLELRRATRRWWWQLTNDTTKETKHVNGSSGKAASKELVQVSRDLTTISYGWRINDPKP